MTILLVEDNEAIILGLEYLLRQEGYRVRTARGLQEAYHLVDAESPDLILLDIMLPDGSGFDFCRRVKEKSGTPIIFLTAREEERDVVQGLDMGADDYVVKPFRNRELVSRIKSVLRRNGRGSSVLKCGDITLDQGNSAHKAGVQDTVRHDGISGEAFYKGGDPGGHMGQLQQFCER